MAVKTRLSIMMFLQFFTWGAWFVTLFLCLGKANLGDYVGDSYQSAPIAAIFAPLFLGLIADRLFASQIVQGLLMLLGTALMAFAAQAVTTSADLAVAEAVANHTIASSAGIQTLVTGAFIHDAMPSYGSQVVGLLIAYMLCYMPTLGLGNSIAFANVQDQNEFPAIRVWGTIGWIVAGLTVGGLGWSDSINMLWLAAAASAVFGLYSFTLPHTPPPAKDKPLDFDSLLMVDAFRLMKSVPFAFFMLCSTLICIPLAYYYSYASGVLADVGFQQPASTMTIGQMSEIIFMLLVPFFFRRLGVKWMILVGMAAWVIRYALFAYGASNQAVWMVLLAVALHGVCYDFFFVTGFMYTDQKAPTEVRGQAQSMLVFFTQGVGMYFGYWVAGWRLGETMTSRKELTDQFAANASDEAVSFFESFTQMFSVSVPEGVDSALLNETLNQWKEFWLLPAGMAAAIFVVFMLSFWEKPSIDEKIAAADNVSDNGDIDDTLPTEVPA